MATKHEIEIRDVRRLALTRAGLLNPRWTGLPSGARAGGKQAREACQRVIERFGYLQLDTIPVAGARSHALVLLSRLPGLDPGLPEELLRPGEPLFEYWGHEASWMPTELYPWFHFRRVQFQRHPWYGDLLAQHPRAAERLLGRLRDEGPLRSEDLEGTAGKAMWEIKHTKKVATALWSSGRVAIRRRSGFRRIYDLTERVIPDAVLEAEPTLDESLEVLLLRALAGHGWATRGTLAATWRLKNLTAEIDAVLERLREEGRIVGCTLRLADGGAQEGWILPGDLELAARLRRVRPRRDHGVLLSPFDPVLWDRDRVRLLFGFDQVLEIYKPAAERRWGYYCLPVLAGEELVGRFDLKADWKRGRLNVLADHPEEGHSDAAGAAARRSALERYASALGLVV